MNWALKVEKNLGVQIGGKIGGGECVATAGSTRSTGRGEIGFNQSGGEG